MLRRGLVAVNPLFGSLGEHISAHNFFNKKLIVEIMCLYNFYMNKFFFFVPLCRSLDFTSALFQALLVKDPIKNMEQAVQESYDATLKPWHGWISSAAFRVIIIIIITFLFLLIFN
jgi:hypothetical protein